MSDSITQQAQHDSLSRQHSRPPIPTALVAEDHADFRELLTLILEQLGYKVLAAGDGEQALHLALLTQPNLIVTDFGLPVMTGLEFVQRVRPALPNPNDCRVIMLTAYDRTDVLPAVSKVACDMILSKPVDLDQFESIVRYFTPPAAPVH